MLKCDASRFYTSGVSLPPGMVNNAKISVPASHCVSSVILHAILLCRTSCRWMRAQGGQPRPSGASTSFRWSRWLLSAQASCRKCSKQMLSVRLRGTFAGQARAIGLLLLPALIHICDRFGAALVQLCWVFLNGMPNSALSAISMRDPGRDHDFDSLLPVLTSNWLWLQNRLTAASAVVD